MKKRITPYLYLLPIIGLFGLLLVYPIYRVIYFSFQNNVIVNPNPVFIGTENFTKILKDTKFWTALKNSLIFRVYQ